MKKVATTLFVLAIIVVIFTYLKWWRKSYQADIEQEKIVWQKRQEMLAEYEQRKASLFDQILKAAGKGVCKKTEECRLIPYGPKVCDGKRGNLIYSSLDVDIVNFAPAVDAYNSFMDTYNSKAIRVFNCVGRAQSAKCLDGACVADR